MTSARGQSHPVVKLDLKNTTRTSGSAAMSAGDKYRTACDPTFTGAPSWNECANALEERVTPAAVASSVIASMASRSEVRVTLRSDGGASSTWTTMIGTTFGSPSASQ